MTTNTGAGYSLAYSVDQYIKLKDAEAKSKLKWHEWYTDPEVEYTLRQMIEHHRWMLADYIDVNMVNTYRDGRPESRLVLHISRKKTGRK